MVTILCVDDDAPVLRGDLQAKLLRVIQEQELERVGGGRTIRVHVRSSPPPTAPSARRSAMAVSGGPLLPPGRRPRHGPAVAESEGGHLLAGSANSDSDDTPDRDRAARGLVVLDSFDVREAERVLIDRALEETGNNRTRAAELLGVSVRTPRNKLNRD